MANNALKDKSILFAVRCVNLYKMLSDERKEYVLKKQTKPNIGLRSC